MVSPSSISATSSRHSGAHTQVSSQEKEPVTPGGFVLLMPVAPPEDMEKVRHSCMMLKERFSATRAAASPGVTALPFRSKNYACLIDA